MATQVYEEKVFKLMNGRDVTVRPLPIKPLRKFMEEWSKIGEIAKNKDATEVDYIDQMFKCAYIVIEFFNEDVTLDEIEDSLDSKTMERIIELGGGIKMFSEADPKAMTKE